MVQVPSGYLLCPLGGFEIKGKSHLQLDASSRGRELMWREVPIHGRSHCQHEAAGGGAPRPSGGGYLGCLLCGAGSSSCNVISCGGEEAIMRGLCGFPDPWCS